MVINGRLDCGYCSTPITRLYGGTIGQQQSYPCPNCGCMNYVTPKITYSASTFGFHVRLPRQRRIVGFGGTAWRVTLGLQRGRGKHFHAVPWSPRRIKNLRRLLLRHYRRTACECWFHQYSGIGLEGFDPGTGGYADSSARLPRMSETGGGKRLKDGEIRPLPQNEFYQSPFDGRWVDLDEEEVFRLIDMQRQSGTRCGKTKTKTCYTRSVHTKET